MYSRSCVEIRRFEILQNTLSHRVSSKYTIHKMLKNETMYKWTKTEDT